MKLILQIKLLPDDKQSKSLLQTIKECNTICNKISNVAWEKKTFNQYRLHNLIYHPIKKSSNLSAQSLVRCISKVVDAYKLDKKVKRQFKSLGTITYDARILSYKENSVSIWSIDGRLKMPFICHNQKYLPYIKGEADLVYKKNKFYLFQTVEIPEEDIKNVEEFIGVDFGIINLATTSNGKKFSGKQVDNVRKRMAKFKKALQKKRTKSAKRHLKKLSGKERRFKKHTNHVISKQIVQSAKDTNKGIALENLKGFKKVSVRKSQREQFGRWSFGELGRFIAYKARLKGIPIVFVDPKNTSRTCSKCGSVSKSFRKSQSLFSCCNCGHTTHADFNASINIASRATVNLPIITYTDTLSSPSLEL